MVLGKKPPPVTATITIALVSCSLAAVTVLLHGDRSLAIGAASFGLAMLVRGVYTIVRAFDRWQEVQWKQHQRALGESVPDRLTAAPLQPLSTALTTEATRAGSASWPLLAANPDPVPERQSRHS